MCGNKAHKNSIKKIRKHYATLAKNPDTNRSNKKIMFIKWNIYKDFVC